MKAVFDQGPFAPCPAPFNLAAHVLRHAERLAGKPALQIVGRGGVVQSWTYGDLRHAVLGIAGGLRAEGLREGDILLMRLGNTVEFPLAYLGAIAADIVPVPTSAQLTEAEVEKIMAELSPKAIVRGEGVPCPATSLPVIDEAALARMHARPVSQSFVEGDPERLAYLVYTSGTSGKARAVMHAHRAIWARQMMVEGWYDLREEDRLMHAGAFNWTYTLGTGLMDPWAAGATALIPEDGAPAEALPDLLAAHEATLFAAAPGVYRKMLTHDMPALPHLRHGFSAGEKLSPRIRKAFEEATGKAIYEAYGMSECSTFISAAPASPVAPEALGRVQAGRRVAVLDPDGPVNLGDPGVIAVHHSDPGLMLSYYGQPEETRARFQGEWFLTGDEGALMADGTMLYLGRADDMMNAGGFRVSPLEVEAVLSEADGIGHVAVTDVEVRDDARLIMAFYTGPAAPEALKAFAEARLAAYKRPRDFVQVDALPQNPNGKVRRRACAALWHDRQKG